jgi:hypothetical protein
MRLEMNFDYELASEPDKIYFNLFNVIGIYGRPVDLYKWIINKTEEVILIWAHGGTEDDPCSVKFLFYWKGDSWYLSFQRDAKPDVNGILNATWEVEGNIVPDKLLSRKDEIINAMKDALHTYDCEISNQPNALSFYQF